MHSLMRAQIWSAVACLCTALLLLAAATAPPAAARSRAGDKPAAHPGGKATAAEQREKGATNKRDKGNADNASSARTRRDGPTDKESAAPQSRSQRRAAPAERAPRGNAHGRSGSTPSTAKSQGRGGDQPATAPADSTADDGPAGNKGSIKVRPVGTAAHPPRNYAHLPCEVQVDFFGVPHDSATLTAASHAPTSPTGETLLTDTVALSSSSENPRGNELVGSTTLDFSSVIQGYTYHEQQGYHVKLTAEIDGPQGANAKHKVFWVDCPPPAGATDGETEDATDDALGDDDTTGGEDDTLTEVATTLPKTPVAADADDAADADADAAAEADAQAEAEGEVLGVFEERPVGAIATAADTAGADAAAAAAPAGLAATGLGAAGLALLALAGLFGGIALLRRTRNT